MGQPYILVESEEKRQTLQTALQEKGEVIVVPANAAVVEVKNVDHLARGEEGFSYKPAAISHDPLKKLLRAGQGDIYLAFDSSERGEYTSWLWAGMLGQLSKGALQCHRLHLAGLDEVGVTTAIESGEPIDSRQAASFYFEECFQRCLATHLNRLLGTRSGPGGVPLSTPVLTTLALMAEREHGASGFSGAPKWHVGLSLDGPKGVFPAQLKEVFGVSRDGVFGEVEQAQDVAGELENQSFRVVSRRENVLEIPAPQPYTLYELIFDAYRYCQVPVRVAMQAATMLFAGLSVGGRHQALISSLFPLAVDKVQPLAKAVGQQVVARFGDEALHSRPLLGYGILPLHPQLGPEELSGLPDVLPKIYDLVWRRALASQMPGATGKEIILDLETEKYRLQSDCPSVNDPGFLQIYQHGFSDLLSAQADDTLQEGGYAKVIQVGTEQRFGMAPDLYTLPSLADDLAELGFRRQEETVQIVGRLCAAGYITAQQNGTLQCDSNLFKVMNTLNRAFPGMQGLNFIVYYAQTLDEVISGRKGFQVALKQFDQNLSIQGKPLVKAKISTSLPSQLQKSKNVIKTAGTSARVARGTPTSAQDNVLGSDFSKRAKGDEGQVSEVPAEAESDAAAAAMDLHEEVAPSAGPGQEAGLETVEGDVEEAPVHIEGEQVVPEQDGGTLVLDEEREAQGGIGQAGEGDTFFQGGDEGLAEPLSSPSAAKDAEGDAGPFQQKDFKEKGVAEVATKPCPECGRAMILKGDRVGRYWACIGAPACRHTEGAIKDAGVKSSIPCPLCHQGQLVIKRTPTGKDMYVCLRESCEFMAWSKPHPIHCPLCSSPFLVEKKGVAGKVDLRCPKAGCNYTHGIGEGKEPEGAVKKKVVVRRKIGSSAGSGKRKVVVRRKK